jgi:hypothetical protein
MECMMHFSPVYSTLDAGKTTDVLTMGDYTLKPSVQLPNSRNT